MILQEGSAASAGTADSQHGARRWLTPIPIAAARELRPYL